MSETSQFQPFFVDRAKGGRASCKGCKDKCLNAELRMAKIVASPYGENQQMKSWFHVDCLMNALLKQRPATKRIDSVQDIGNWENMTKDDQEFMLEKINEMEKLYEQKNSGKYTAKVITNEKIKPLVQPKESTSNKNKTVAKESEDLVQTNDNHFYEFTNLCKSISKVDAYTDKTAVVNNFFTKGTDGSKFRGDLALWCKLLLPQAIKRVYNLKSKQLVKLFSRIFNTDQDSMLTHLEQGDVAKTISHFHKKAKTYEPAEESTLTIHSVEEFLESLSKLTKEEEQIYQFKKIIKRCTTNDLKMIIRLIKGDLRINAGPKHILEGVHPDAYNVFQTSRNLDMVLERVLQQNSEVRHRDSIQSTVKAELQIMTPVLPMLAEACKSVEMAMKKCPNGMFSEIKYDGERVQVHKKGFEFKYFSRSLKPVLPHKVNHFKDYLPKAFPDGEDLILDAEVLMVDVKNGKPLPFGTLGIHKQSAFKDAQVCLFVFDCLYYNGEDLMGLPIRKRRKILYKHMVEIKNHVMFSEQKLIREPGDLADMIAEVLKLGLEGLVLKDLESIYEPGKRHWLKVKKDYLFDGAMADTADLVVLGAWFGTGKKGGMMSVFLMGCLDKRRNKWVTVTKVHTGHDDATLERLQKELGPLMNKISQDSYKVPSWMDCNKGLVPDFIAKDPKEQPVWEITGTEFTKANIHTADGISVRFPRVTRIRSDKNWETATNLDELKHLFKTSKEKTDVSLLNKIAETATKSEDKGEVSKAKIKQSPSKLKTLDSYFGKGKTSTDNVKIKEELNTSSSSNKSDNSHSMVKNEDVLTNSEKKSKKQKIEDEKTESKIKSEDRESKKERKRRKEQESLEKRSHDDVDGDCELPTKKIKIKEELSTKSNSSDETLLEDDLNTSKRKKSKKNKLKEEFTEHEDTAMKDETKDTRKEKKRDTKEKEHSKNERDNSEITPSKKNKQKDLFDDASAKNQSESSDDTIIDDDLNTSEVKVKKRKTNESSHSESDIKKAKTEDKNKKHEEKDRRKDHDKKNRDRNEDKIKHKDKLKGSVANSKYDSEEELNQDEFNSTFDSKSTKRKHEIADDSDTNSNNDDTEVNLLIDDLMKKHKLSNIFDKLKLGFYPDFISFSVEEQDIFERHWIAYGGEVIKSLKATDVDYVVHTNDTIDFKSMQRLRRKFAPNVKHVRRYWLHRCINYRKLYNPSRYYVVVEPER